MEWWESLREVLSSRTLFSVVLDILLMSFILYRILLLVRGTRGLLMLLGLAAVYVGGSVVLSLVAMFAGMAAMRSVFA